MSNIPIVIALIILVGSLALLLREIVRTSARGPAAFVTGEGRMTMTNETMKKDDPIELAAERYWLDCMDLGYAKRRAQVEASKREEKQPRPLQPIIRL